METERPKITSLEASISQSLLQSYGNQNYYNTSTNSVKLQDTKINI